MYLLFILRGLVALLNRPAIALFLYLGCWVGLGCISCCRCCVGGFFFFFFNYWVGYVSLCAFSFLGMYLFTVSSLFYAYVYIRCVCV